MPMLNFVQFQFSNLSIRASSLRWNALFILSALIFHPTVDAQTKKNIPKKPNPITIYAAGDIADCRKQAASQSGAAQTAALITAGIQQDKNAHVFTLGDNTYPVGKAEEFNDCYDQTWGQFKQRTLPSPGNHDYGIPLASGYYNYFDELAGSNRRGYYKKTLGNWLIISLNSNIKHQAMQTQLTWLQSTLRENQASCILAFWHHPVYSSGGHGNNKVMQDAWKLLADAKADLVLTSHDHHYERFAPLDKNGVPDAKNGIRSFVVGTGGAKLSPIFLVKDGSEVRQNDHHGVLKLALTSNAFSWEFIAAESKQILDKGEATCHVSR